MISPRIFPGFIFTSLYFLPFLTSAFLVVLLAAVLAAVRLSVGTGSLCSVAALLEGCAVVVVVVISGGVGSFVAVICVAVVDCEFLRS